uniref:LIM and calponin homology domains 1a n=1 Tax=Astatotilapia calliptera TaxID=8154 RepID=A0AAX7UBW4_ASTCA
MLLSCDSSSTLQSGCTLCPHPPPLHLCFPVLLPQAVTGKSFGDKDFRSALENGILLCELLSAIKPGLVKKINRLPTPIAGLDNLSVFLRGCEELGLKGAQLFDPGDLQDTSIRANLKDSDCNRKLKNVLNTVYWLGKAASGCASYSGPTLNLKEFEGLLAQMKLESEEGGDSSQKRNVRDSGYDCWDSERSESLSPPRHTRDNSLDSLDSFGSRSQHSPSPDVVNRGNSDGRGSDSEADAPNRKPDVRKDDMLARRTSSKEARSSVPFNQFLPNRTNATSYVPTPRRKPHTEEREQRSLCFSRSVSMGDMLNEEEVGHLPSLSQSRHEHMHEQYNNFLEDEDHWQDDLARWKNRRRSASQDLIRKEEERKRIEKRMKGEGRDGNKRKSIKTYKEIVEEKERREADLCEAYRSAVTPEEAALVLQRYALRFTISDAVLDTLKLPRSTSTPKNELNELDKEQKPESPTKHTSPQSAQGQPHPTQSANALPSPPSVSSRPIPLLAAKPYCQPGAVLPGHKPIKIETPMLNLAKRVNHWVWDPNEERKRLERWQQEQERLLKEQYQREQEKLMKEWEKAQLEVEEEERKHNEEVQTSRQTHFKLKKKKKLCVLVLHVLFFIFDFLFSLCFFQERRILEETVTPLNPTGLLNQVSGQTATTSPGTENDNTKGKNVPLQCVSGKRLCTGCSQPLGKGAAMIIDTLGLFFHMHCFKCGLCGVQLGDATAGTDVRIRKGMLSCHECYIASRGEKTRTPTQTSTEGLHPVLHTDGIQNTYLACVMSPVGLWAPF